MIELFSFQMAVESNYAISQLLHLIIGAKKSRTSFSTNEKQNQNQSHLVRAIFPEP